jgi:predicted O-methyltransferase YrrM
VNLYSLKRFLKYYLFSSHKKGHGIHSPFVFNLVINVFRNKITPDIVCKIENIRKGMISDKQVIEVTDFGTGSKTNKGRLRRVSEIVRKSSVQKKYGELLAGLSKEFGRNSVIEFGTSLGISTMYMGEANLGATIYTMEGCPSISEIALKNFSEAGLTNIRLHTGSFENVLPVLENLHIRPGLVYIDGNHRKSPTIEYFNRMAELSDKETVIVIDDIYSSREMGEAWREIKENKKVSFTIDIFRMGIVFFREGMTRSDYIIRY